MFWELRAIVLLGRGRMIPLPLRLLSEGSSQSVERARGIPVRRKVFRVNKPRFAFGLDRAGAAGAGFGTALIVGHGRVARGLAKSLFAAIRRGCERARDFTAIVRQIKSRFLPIICNSLDLRFRSLSRKIAARLSSRGEHYRRDRSALVNDGPSCRRRRRSQGDH